MFEQKFAAENRFLKEIETLREGARNIMRTDGQASAATSIALLQSVLAAEIVCVLRYTMISVSPDGLKNAWIGAEFQEQANDERRHMALAAGRIEQLGGRPDYHPPGLASGLTALAGDNAGITRRVHENLAAERSVIEHYHELIGYFATRDPATGAILSEMVRDEEDHTSDMEDLLASYAG